MCDIPIYSHKKIPPTCIFSPNKIRDFLLNHVFSPIKSEQNLPYTRLFRTTLLFGPLEYFLMHDFIRLLMKTRFWKKTQKQMVKSRGDHQPPMANLHHLCHKLHEGCCIFQSIKCQQQPMLDYEFINFLIKYLFLFKESHFLSTLTNFFKVHTLFSKNVLNFFGSVEPYLMSMWKFSKALFLVFYSFKKQTKKFAYYWPSLWDG